MSLKDQYDFTELKNDAEEAVLLELERVLEHENPGVCTCDDCVLDMACLAMNHVKPRYRVSLMGSLYSDMDDPEMEQEIKKAVNKAITIVKENPSHD